MFALILLYLALTIIRPQDYIPALAGVPLLSSVLIVTVLCWVGSVAKTFAAPQFVLLPVFLLALMVSEVANGWSGGTLDQLLQFGPVVAAFFVLAMTVSASRERVHTTLVVFSLCALVLAVHGVDQSIYGIGWTGVSPLADGRIQYVGIFHDPNDLGLLFVTTLPMTVYLSGGGGFLRRMFWLVGAALLLYGIYLTNSRGAMLAVLVVGGGYVWYRRGLVAAGTLAAIGLLCMRMLSSRMQELDADESSAAGRVDAWYEGLHMFLAKPLFGIGAGNFTDYNYLTAHNSFVLVLAETGLFGFITWLAFIGYTFWMMAAILRTPTPPSAYADSPTDLDSRPARANADAAGNRVRRRLADASAPTPVLRIAARAITTTSISHASPRGDATNAISEWGDERQLALTLLLSLCGMFAAAFFLSRSYTVVLYLVIAVVVGYYVGVRRRYPGLPGFPLGQSWLRWMPVAIAAIAALFMIVELLLHSE